MENTPTIDREQAEKGKQVLNDIRGLFEQFMTDFANKVGLELTDEQKKDAKDSLENIHNEYKNKLDSYVK